MKERIEYIDLAKGICILLVVLDHIAGYRYFSDGNYPMNDIFEQTRMPLYFILSGLFFKDYGGIRVPAAQDEPHPRALPFLFDTVQSVGEGYLLVHRHQRRRDMGTAVVPALPLLDERHLCHNVLFRQAIRSDRTHLGNHSGTLRAWLRHCGLPYWLHATEHRLCDYESAFPLDGILSEQKAELLPVEHQVAMGAACRNRAACGSALHIRRRQFLLPEHLQHAFVAHLPCRPVGARSAYCC